MTIPLKKYSGWGETPAPDHYVVMAKDLDAIESLVKMGVPLQDALWRHDAMSIEGRKRMKR